jgi:hypothetical protein
MSDLLRKLLEGPFKRFAVFLLSAGIVALNKRLELNLSEVEIGSIATMTAAYLLQSGMKAANALKADAANKATEAVKTAQDAVDQLKRMGAQ